MTRRLLALLALLLVSIAVGAVSCDERLSRQLDNVDITIEEVTR
jgi:hypothetical protein